MSRPRDRTFRGPKKNFSVRFPEDLYDYFSKVADDSGLGIADVISSVLDEVATAWILDRPREASVELGEGDSR